MELTYKTLTFLDDEQIVQGINLAFSDYYLPIHLDTKTLPIFMQTNQVDKNLSWAAINQQGEVVGIILNAQGEYQHQTCLFDVATGVIPTYRNQHVFSNLFDKVIQCCQTRQIPSYYLEVLCQNKKAIDIYQQKGFQKVRTLDILIANKAITKQEGYKSFNIEPLNVLKTEYAKDITIIDPSFENTSVRLEAQLDLYQIIYSLNPDQKIDNFIIYHYQSGNIVQMGYSNLIIFSQMIIVLLNQYQQILIQNIDHKHQSLINCLINLGFSINAQQYEMVKKISL